MLKTGLQSYRPKPTDLALDAVWDAGSAGPEDCGDLSLPWGMWGNDQYGDCFFASAANETVALSALAGRHRPFATAGVLASYAKYLGVPHLTRENDRGTEPASGAAFRRKTGVLDAHGRPSHIGAYVFDRVPDYTKLARAIYDFGAVEFCFDFPASAMDAFEAGHYVWDYEGGPLDGGHAVAGVAVSRGHIWVVSWGEPVRVTPAFVEHYLQCAIVYVSGSQLHGGESVHGLDAAELRRLLQAVTS